MSAIAVASRVSQFRAGPQAETFYACAACLPALTRGEAGGGNFFTTVAEPVRPVDPADEITCDLCREGE
jgi:hypothetical protein